jgi:hypothetical protein
MEIQNELTRRDALKRLSAGALLTLGLWPGCATPQQTAAKPFRFLVVNDTHFMSSECGAWLERVVAQMKTHSGAEFCLFVGDLVEKGESAHLGAVREIFANLSMPIHVQIGNHDYLTQRDRSAYERLFPNQLNYWFEHRGWQFVGMDSTDGLEYEQTRIQDPTMEWLHSTLPTLNRTKPTVIFTHFPLGASVRYRPANADAALDLFRPFDLRAVFNGHFHGFTENHWNNASVVTNKCCALKRGNHDNTTEKGYFVCTVQPGGDLVREFVEVKPAK